MEIATAQIPMGPDAEERIAALLSARLNPSSASLPDAVRQVAARVSADLGRLPWTSGLLAWLRHRDVQVTDRVMEALRTVVADPDPSVSYGAALLMISVVEQAQNTSHDEVLFHLAASHPDREVQRMLTAYLLATGRTRRRALHELQGVPAVAEMVQRQGRLATDLRTWRSLLRDVSAAPAGSSAQTVKHLVASVPDLLFDLENSFLDVFEQADPGQRSGLVRFLLDALQAQEEQVQTFACDLLTAPHVLETARKIGGYRLGRVLHKVETDPDTSVSIRQYVASIRTMLETSVTIEQLQMAARGQMSGLTPSDWQKVADGLHTAGEWFAGVSSQELAELPFHPNWNLEDYAFAVLNVLGDSLSFPVPLEQLCARLGVYLRGERLASGLDGVLIHRPDLPGPVVVFNLVASEARRRFTIAHELAHAVLPCHLDHAIYLSSVVEAAADPHQGPHTEEVAVTNAATAEQYLRYEREADRFAAALLMPARWFAPEVQRTPYSLTGLQTLQERFGVSLTAAAFRAIQFTRESVAVLYAVNGAIRYKRSTDEFMEKVRWEATWPMQVPEETLAHALAAEAVAGSVLEGRVAAWRWLGRSQVEELWEESLCTAPGHVLIILNAEHVDD